VPIRGLECADGKSTWQFAYAAFGILCIALRGAGQISIIAGTAMAV
jgi:hypothetical protein